jgi:hypothetical protein
MQGAVGRLAWVCLGLGPLVVAGTCALPHKRWLVGLDVGTGLWGWGISDVVHFEGTVVLTWWVSPSTGLLAPLFHPLSIIKNLTSHLDGEDDICMAMVGSALRSGSVRFFALLGKNRRPNRLYIF